MRPLRRLAAAGEIARARAGPSRPGCGTTRAARAPRLPAVSPRPHDPGGAHVRVDVLGILFRATHPPLVRHVRVRQASADDLDRRPVVRLTVRIGDMTEKAEFTLKDRSGMTFPVLLGRVYLKDIAVVDVAREYIQPKPKLKDVK